MIRERRKVSLLSAGPGVEVVSSEPMDSESEVRTSSFRKPQSAAHTASKDGGENQMNW